MIDELGQGIVTSQQKTNDDLQRVFEERMNFASTVNDKLIELGNVYLDSLDEQQNKLDKNAESGNAKDIARAKANFEKKKKAMIIMANIQNAAAAVQSFFQGGGFPYGLIPMGLSIATGIAQIVKIKNTKWEGGPSESNAPAPQNNGGLSTLQAPQISTPVQAVRTQLTQEELNLQSQPIKAYVVESELSKVQERVLNTQNKARF